MAKVNRNNLPRFYSEYLDGSLDAEAAARFREILDGDPGLRADFDRFVRTRDLIETLPGEHVGPGFEREVLDRLHRAKENSPGRLFPAEGLAWRPAAAAITLLAAAVSLVPDRPAREPVAREVPSARLAPPPGPRRGSTPTLEDPVIASRILEVSALLQEIERLRAQAARGPGEIVLGESGGQEFVIRPNEFYRRALQASQRQGDQDPTLRHAQ